MNSVVIKRKFIEDLTSGFLQGLSWAFGVTFGFTVVSAIVVLLINRAGGIPVIGEFLARVVAATVSQLDLRTPYFFRQ